MPVDLTDRPTIVVLGASSDDPPPGLAPALDDEVDLRFAVGSEELRQALPGAEALFVWDFRADQLRDAWEARDRLEWIHVAGAGVDAVLFPALRDADDVLLTNSQGVFDEAIAEYVVAAMLVFAKDLLTSIRLQRDHTWRHRETERLLDGQLVVVGAGSIGRAIARRAAGLRMQVVGVARDARADDPDFARVVGSDELHDVLADADYVAVAVPLTPATEGLIGAAELRRMKPSARLVNVARGAVVDQQALIDALETGEIAGAALDVFEEEPLPEDSPLWDLPDVIVTPHMSGDFIGWHEALTERFLDNYRRWRAGQDLRNVVDKERGYVASTTEDRSRP